MRGSSKGKFLKRSLLLPFSGWQLSRERMKAWPIKGRPRLRSAETARHERAGLFLKQKRRGTFRAPHPSVSNQRPPVEPELPAPVAPEPVEPPVAPEPVAPPAPGPPAPDRGALGVAGAGVGFAGVGLVTEPGLAGVVPVPVPTPPGVVPGTTVEPGTPAAPDPLVVPEPVPKPPAP